MEAPEFPLNEPDRLIELYDYGVLDTPQEKVFDDIVELAARICDAPSALINLIDAERQWFKASFGIEHLNLGPDRMQSICAHTILHANRLEITDTVQHALFQQDVAGGQLPTVRFYAGVNLVTPRGYIIGVLCVFGPEPKSLSNDRWEALFKLADIVVTLFNAKKEERIKRQIERRGVTLEAILNSAGEGLLAIDQQGRCIIANSAAAQMCGWPEEELLNHSMHALIHHSRPDGRPYPVDECLIQATLRDGEVRRTYEEVFWRRDGQPFPVDYTVRPLIDGDVIAGCVVTFNDISERRQQAQALRALSAHLQSVREEERARIARDIHDELGGTLAAIKYELSVALQGTARSGNDSPPAGDHPTLRLVDDGINALRRIMADLRPSVLDDLGLWAALEWLVDEFRERNGLVCVLDIGDVPDEVDAAMATTLFRIAQEALTNITRHAQASRVQIETHVYEGELILTIIDDGRGLSQAKGGVPTFGISGMVERARTHGGTAVVESRAEGGTRVHVRLPLDLLNGND